MIGLHERTLKTRSGNESVKLVWTEKARMKAKSLSRDVASRNDIHVRSCNNIQLLTYVEVDMECY